jgi:acetoin utilization protein AcuB
MARAKVHVGQYMTPTPHTVGTDQPMSLAHRLMREQHCRHLPVLRGGQVVGVVSDRDLHLVETLNGVDPDEVTVEEAMSESPYCVPSSEALDVVVAEMAKHKYGCTLVVDDGKATGIFTTVDVCSAFADFLRAADDSAAA